MHSRSVRSGAGGLLMGLVVSAVVPWSGRAWAGTQLPVPCLAGSCGTNASRFVTTGSATAVQSGKTLSVKQTSSSATLNWSSFNISADGKVVFAQPAATSIALNRIFDANPSSIFGTLTSNGQIYLINANGFLFGSGATVNVGGALASSLNLSDANFAAGILAPGLKGPPQPALQSFVDAAGNVISGSITVDAGATLTAINQGRILLAAPNVSNAGSLNAPDGQVILAAGRNLYLQASSDSSLRGLIVEVDAGGSAANQLTGAISAARGNVTLTGLMVNQDGRVSATTSVAANGSVILQAADTFPSNYSLGNPFSAARGGTVVLGPGSLTEVLPELSDNATAVPLQTQLHSSITITGQQVLMNDAVIAAPSGQLNVTAEANPSAGVQSTGNPNAQIRIDSGTSIDLSGSQAQLPMDANLLSVQLRSNELADDPTQRGGALQSTPTNTVTVTVDMRADNGAGSPIADLGSAIAAVGQNIAQRTETGGTAKFVSEGDVVLHSGASINVSGGATTYEGGTIQTSYLVGANGQLYNIGTANPLLAYKGVVNPTVTQSYDKWGIREVIPTPGLSQYESTYLQGAAAGSVQFAAPSLLLAGSLQGSAVSGPYQRGAPPPGGTLTIGVPAGVATTSSNLDYLAPSVVLTNSLTPIAVADGAPLPVQALQLPISYLASDGFTNTQIFSNTSIALPAGLPLALTPGGSLALVAPRIDVDSSIASLGGTLSFENVLTSASPASAYTPGPGLIRPGIGIGAGVTLDVSGQWTNDATLAGGIGTAPTYLNGGRIALQLTTPGSELVLGGNDSLLANGGAWLQSGGTVSYGTGGAITLDASPSTAAVEFASNTLVQGFGAGTAKGGTFTLYATRIDVSQGSGASWTQAQAVDDLNNTTGPVLDLFAPLFTSYGFSSVNLTATGAAAGVTSDVLTVAAGTSINAATSNLQLDSNYMSVPTGGTLAAISAPTVLPLYERPAASVSLNVIREADDAVALGNSNYGLLDVRAGSSISTDPGGSIALTGEGGVNIGGALRAPGGSISVFIPAPADINSGNADVTDPGYVPTLGIDLAPTAVLAVSGATVMQPNSQGLLTGTLLPGGSVRLTADRGTVTTEAGSTIDFSGASAVLDVPNAASGATTRELLASAGGAFSASAGESISLLGNFNGAAGIGSNGTAAAGSLTVDVTRTLNSVVQGSGPPLPSAPLEIELLSSTAGAAPSPADADVAVLGARQIGNSGVDALSLQADSNVLIDAGLSLARQLSINSATISAPITATLSAPAVELGNSATSGAPAVVPIPPGGNGDLTVSAQQMVLQGNFALQGTSQVTLSSAGDVQLQGTSANGATGPTTGSLLTHGKLAIDALRVYPDTFTAFAITSLPGAGSSVSIGSTGSSPGSPLSAAGAVAVSADNIAVSGTLLAPFGSINLTAHDALTLAKGSLLSVSGAGLTVPFGETQLNQGEWIYETPNGTQNPIASVPTKAISLSAPNVVVQAGATANVQGGGELYAYEWVPGTGGSSDNLNAVCCASAGNVALTSYPNLFAILPGERGQAGPYDPRESATAVSGQTIYLSGGAGIAAGYYALLPPRYALEPGAVLIQLEPAVTNANGGKIGALASGTPVIGGFLSIGTTGLNTGGLAEYEGVAVYPSGYATKLANYTISDASSYFAAQAASAGTGPVSEPADAGTFTLSVTPSMSNSLSLEGSVLTAAASGGRGAQVNISAPDLEITGPGGSNASGSSTVSGSVLQSWNASSLTLGGASTTLPVDTAISTSTGAASSALPAVDIAVAANTVTVDPGVQLVADQIELVALQSIDVQAGASLLSTSGKSGTALKTLPAKQTVYLTGAPYSTVTDAAANQLAAPALLSVSDLALPVASRSALNGSAGASIDVAEGATLTSGGALSIDAPGDVTLAGTLTGRGASWSLSSGSVAFVGAAASADSLNIDGALLSSLQQAGALRISSQGNIDIDTPVALGVGAAGTVPLSSLTLVGNAINNNAAGSSAFGAASLTLGGNITPTSAAPAPAAATSGGGALSFVADTMVVGPGELSVNGFAHTTAQVAGVFEGTGSSYLNVGGNLAINAVELTAAPVATDLVTVNGDLPGYTNASGTTIATTGTLTVGAPTSLGAGTTLPTLVGGSLALMAGNIEDAGVIVAPAGVVDLNSSGSLHLASTASISAAGTAIQAVNQTAYSPGGLVQLSAAGNLSLDAGSSISVAGTAKAPAGTLNLTDQGVLTLAGTIDGAAPAGNTGGSLMVAAGTLAGGLASLATNPGLPGFDQAVNVRVRSGDLDLAAGETIIANSITLTADSGTVDIAGVLSAPSAAQRGFIHLSGGTSVTLASTGQLHADGNGSAGRGGEIDLNSVTSSCTATTCTSSGSISLLNGSVITAVGAAQMGALVLRAPALTAANDVAINAGQSGIGAAVSEAGQVIIEPVLVTPTSSATSGTDLGNAASTAAGFLTTAVSTIGARLASPSATPVNVQAGIELQDPNASDALALPALDLSQYSTQGQVINVAVRAAGSITIDATISDGFTATSTRRGGAQTELTNQPSGSLTFVAGADLSSANPISVLADSASALTLGSQAVVRTGTGNIDLAAAGDVVFQSGLSGGAAVYTAGLAGAPAVIMGSGRRLGNFATNGGNVRVIAGNSVVGAPFVDPDLDGGDFSVTGWQPRGLITPTIPGQAPGPAQYGVNFDEFDWNVGALGGGDVSVQAGGTVSQLSAATADSSPDGGVTLYGAGGGLRVTAVGDIGTSQFYVADGTGTIATNAGMPAIVAGTTPGTYLGSTFALGNSSIAVWARQSLQVDGLYNPSYAPAAAQTTGAPVNFFTYGSNSGLSLSSTNGSATLEIIADRFDLGVLLGPPLVNSPTGFDVLPANLSIQALQQDVDVNPGSSILFPSSTGQLTLFAGRDINAPADSILAMADSFPSAVWTAAAPQTQNPAAALDTVGGLAEFQGAIHAGDPNPALITAGRDINDLGLAVPKAADIVAGRDIVNLTYKGQNVSSTDISLITAGRDMIDNNTSAEIAVGGAGSLDLFAGRNVNLGVGGGITTLGDLVNANLPSPQGADITLALGYGTQGADYSSFLQKIIDPTTATAYQQQLINYVDTLTGQSGLSFAQAQTIFENSSQSQQAALIDDVFFNELLLSGRAANSGSGVGFTEGYAAIDALYPGSRSAATAAANPYSGNLDLITSQIYTLSGGNISILVPGGAIDVGLAFTPAGLIQKPAYLLGIVAEGAGNVDIYSLGDVNVNASRIFTLGGGNILIWSDKGSIDAGNGSKSSLSVPPPVVSVSSDGTISLDYGASLSAGSGIRTIQTNPGVPPGNVDLDAPVGTVNAGDAGIGASGNINIAAAHVIGALNINFGGTATGVPSDLSGLAASLSGVSAVGAGATNSSTNNFQESNNLTKETAPLAQTELSWLEVFVTGLGEENCKQDDVECLRRQKSAAP